MVGLEIKRKAREIGARGNDKQSQEQERIVKESRKSRTNILILAIVLGALLVVFMMFAPGSDDSRDVEPSPANNYVPEKSNPYPFPVPNPNQKTYTNSIGMDFVLIPEGKFDMGSPSSEMGRYDFEEPVHRVKIPDRFYLGKYEVTQKQWVEVMGSNPSFFKGDDLPVESVSWNDVQEFIKKLNAKEGTDKYRLPSEAEWEYAGRAGTTTRYSFGNDLDTSIDPKLGDYAWCADPFLSGPHPVGQYKPNPWELYDMHGNVFEWVQDEIHYSYNGAPSDGSAWESGDGSVRVFRGGSWRSPVNVCRSAFRDGNYPDSREDYVGFRLLRAQ